MSRKIIIAAAALLVACGEGGGEPALDLACVAEGRCECLTSADCPDGGTCVNGQCFGVIERPDVSAATVAEVAGTDVALIDDFLAACIGDDDCSSQKCVALAAGQRVCTRTCFEECPVGWDCRGVDDGGGPILFYCLPQVDRLCDPCNADAACTGGGLCLDVGGTLRCGADCAETPCLGGYACQPVVSVEGAPGTQCLPMAGVCQCSAETAGSEVACETASAYGVCPGRQTCLSDGSLTACDAKTPLPEDCNGADDDCDGFTDEGISDVPCEKTNAAGTCTGVVKCFPKAGAVCTAAEPAIEACDGLDNDCDTAVDEDFQDAAGQYVSVLHCGACNHPCAGLFAHAATVGCQVKDGAASCVVQSCDVGWVKVTDTLCAEPLSHLCEPCTSDFSCVGPADLCLSLTPTDTQTYCGRDCAPGSIYGTTCPAGYTCKDAPGGALQCVPKNSSCDCGPSNAGQVKPCAEKNEYGACFGVSTCDAALGWTGCTAGTPAAEVCNGSDDDCDGLVDEELTGAPCVKTTAFGTCIGKLACKGKDGIVCTAAAASAEVCNGKDDDCDAETDEGFAQNVLDQAGNVAALVYDLTNEHCGGCGIPCTAAFPASTAQCEAESGDVHCAVKTCASGYFLAAGKACVPVPSGNLCLPCTTDAECVGPKDRCLGALDGALGRCGRDCLPGAIYTADSEGGCPGIDGEQGCCPAGYLCDGGQCVRESGSCDCDLDGKLRPCKVTSAIGTCGGFQVCVSSGPGAGWTPCSAPAATAETCNGVDDDCDGLIDALDPSLDTSTLPGYPACQNVSSACSGAWSCAAGGWTCTAKTPEPETCNGQDDDCDGETDDGFTGPGGLYTTLSSCGHCGLDCAQAFAHLLPGPGAVACEVVQGQPTCVPKQCEPGYTPFPTAGVASVCLPLAVASCQPCATDVDCGPAGAACVGVGSDDGTWCAQRCDAAAPWPGCTGEAGAPGCCPPGFGCDGSVCVPASGSCQCTASSVGLVRPCTTSVGAASCFGASHCQASGAWGPCDTSANIEVCDGADNDCDGDVDDGFLEGGVYASDTNCGACGKSCLAKWTPDIHHAAGVCDKALPGGPDCVLGPCQAVLLGGGTRCASDAECAGDLAGPKCLAAFHQCGQPCAQDVECPGGLCRDASCTVACASDATCTAAFGEGSGCVLGACRATYQYVDLDGLTGNGCECPASPPAILDEPELFASWPAPGAKTVDSNCDGVDGDVATALFVSAESGAGDGSAAAPFPAIQEAVAAFKAGVHTQILVASGVYVEQVTLKPGIKIYGGYSPDFLDRDLVLHPTVIAAPEPVYGAPGALAGTMRASGITVPTLVSGFEIRGYDVSASPASLGQSSFAVVIEASSSALVLQANRIVGGAGGPGFAGGQGGEGASGGPGAGGKSSVECVNGQTCTGGGCDEKSCSGHVQPGGAGGTSPACGAALGCPGMESEGGESAQVSDAPPPGCTYETGGTNAVYLLGPASLCKYDCIVPPKLNGGAGQGGAAGPTGTGGSGCKSGLGLIAGGQWIGSGAGAGASGQSGTGGQGGSAGGYVNNSKASTCTVGNLRGDLGGSGGGGGSGGCGGTGGAPGGAAGASFAVFVASGAAGTFATLTGNVVVRGQGGAGGAGGNGGTGGKGGSGGAGGKSGAPAWCAGEGGAGGRGGDGGGGGGGGGGCGGPSIGIGGVAIPATAYSTANVFAAGDEVSTGGPGGTGGGSPVAGSAGGAGMAGASKNVHAF